MRKYLLLGLMATSSLLASFQPYFEGNGRFFDFLRGGGATLWVPAYQDDCQLFFMQGHGGYYRKFLTKWSIGAGYRRLWSPSLGFGANAFYDIGHSDAGHNFFQGGVGLEAFGPCWVARANGYFPRRRTIALDNEAALIGTTIVPNNLRQVTYTGFDLEAGYGVPLCNGEVWGYAGYYYYDARQVRTIQGPKLRGEYVYYASGVTGPQFSIGGEYRYDQVHKSEGALIIRLRVPLSTRLWRCGNTCVPRIRRRMGAPARRELNMWVEKTRVLDRNTTLANAFFASATGTAASGTQADPTTLADAVARASVGDVIFLLSDAGTITGPVTLQNQQQFVGFGDATMTTLNIGGQLLTINKLNPAGVRPTMTGAGDLITAARANVVQGIALMGGVRYLNGNNTGDLLVNDIVATGATGGDELFLVSGASNPTLTNSSLSSTAGPTDHVVNFSTVTGHIIVERNVITHSGANMGFAVQIFNSPATGVIANNVIDVSASFNEGIGISNTITGEATFLIAANSFVGLGGNLAIRVDAFSSGSLNITIEDHAFMGYTGIVMILRDRSSGVVNYMVQNNTFTPTATSIQTVIDLLSASGGISNFTVRSNTFANHTAGSGTAVALDRSLSPGPDVLTFLMENNTGTNMRQMFDYDLSAPASNTDFITVRNNSATPSGTPDIAYDFNTQGAGTTVQACYTIENNSATTGFTGGINVGAPAAGGSINVFPSNTPAGLSAANPGVADAITVGAGVAQATGPCPLPPPVPRP